MLLLNTNLVVLLIVGTFDRAMIPRFRRTDVFTPSDLDVLKSKLTPQPEIATTSAILAETSNLLAHYDHLRDEMCKVCRGWKEIVVPVAHVLADPAFARLGFTDVMTLHAATEHVITADAPLYRELLNRERNAENFHHLR